MIEAAGGSVSPAETAAPPPPPAPAPPSLTAAPAEASLQPGLAWDLGVRRKQAVFLSSRLPLWSTYFRTARPGFLVHPSLLPGRCEEAAAYTECWYRLTLNLGFLPPPPPLLLPLEFKALF